MNRYCLIITAFIMTMAGKIHAQQSCCTSPAMAFNNLSLEKEFVEAHLPPAQVRYEPRIGKMVSLKTTDGPEVAVFEVRSGATQGKVVLMFHEWWGMTDQMKKAAEQLHQEAGATVLLIDLYEKKVTYNPDTAAKMMQSLNEQRVRSIIKAAIDYCGKFSKIQTVGWCMGGTWSLQASIMAGQMGYGCVVYYGMPELNARNLAPLQAPVLGFYGKKDLWISPEIVREFDITMKSLGKNFTAHSFDADHAFANPSNPKFNKEATAKANALMVDFLKKNFETPLRKQEVPEGQKD
jgi:carboxymethylenebutenolidase